MLKNSILHKNRGDQMWFEIHRPLTCTHVPWRWWWTFRCACIRKTYLDKSLRNNQWAWSRRFARFAHSIQLWIFCSILNILHNLFSTLHIFQSLNFFVYIVRFVELYTFCTTLYNYTRIEGICSTTASSSFWRSYFLGDKNRRQRNVGERYKLCHSLRINQISTHQHQSASISTNQNPSAPICINHA